MPPKLIPILVVLFLFSLHCNILFHTSAPHASSISSEQTPRNTRSLLHVVDRNQTSYSIKFTLASPEWREKRDADSGDSYDDGGNGTSNDTYFNETASREQYLEDIRHYIYPRTWMWVLIFFHSVVFVVGLVGNTLVCVAVYRNHTMRTVTNYFIVNLAVADFLVILFCLPPSVVWDVTSTWFFGIAMCKIVLYLQSVSVTVSVLTLTFISVDRWYAICFPFKFKSTTGRAKTAIAIIWLVALISDIPEAISLETHPNLDLGVETIYFTQCEPTWSKETDTMFLLIKMVLLYAFPLIFMSIAYLQIIRVLWKSGNSSNQGFDMPNTFQMNMNTSTEGQLRSRRKAAKMLVAVVVMFAICYFPVHLMSLLRLVMTLNNTETNQAISMIAHWLCYVNSAVNPIIYNFMSGKFRKEFQRAFEQCWQPAVSHQRSYHLNTFREGDRDSGTISRCSRWNVNNTAKFEECNGDAVENLLRRGTKTSVVRIDV